MFVARGKEDALVTKNMIPGETIYGEKRISVDQVHYTHKKKKKTVFSCLRRDLIDMFFCNFRLKETKLNTVYGIRLDQN